MAELLPFSALDEATAMRVLSLQYDSHVSSVSSSKKMGLLEALDTEVLTRFGGKELQNNVF